jgi:hypothetical protein
MVWIHGGTAPRGCSTGRRYRAAWPCTTTHLARSCGAHPRCPRCGSRRPSWVRSWRPSGIVLTRLPQWRACGGSRCATCCHSPQIFSRLSLRHRDSPGGPGGGPAGWPVPPGAGDFRRDPGRTAALALHCGVLRPDGSAGHRRGLSPAAERLLRPSGRAVAGHPAVRRSAARPSTRILRSRPTSVIRRSAR